MPASDYIFVTGWLNAYLAKRNKSIDVMSKDRRVISENEIIGLFEFYIRKYCAENNTDTLIINKNGKKIFEAKLIDKE